MPGPMEGVRVVEMGVWIAGPAAAMILADWGADVIKIEPPTGDPGRKFREMLGAELPSNPPFELDNRGKRSVVFDVGTDEGRELALRLVDEADVFVSNMRPGALERMGFDAESVTARNPRLIYCAMTAYGLEGDDVDKAGFDIAAFWARGGLAHMLTPPGGQPPFQRGGMGDHNTGLAAAGAISAALFHRERTGEGQVVSTSLFREAAYTIGFDVNTALLWGSELLVGTREGLRQPTATYYTASDDRMFWLVGMEPERHWPPLCRAVGREEWLDDERFATVEARGDHIAELLPLLDEVFATQPFAHWAARFDDEPELFWAPINSVYDLIADPQAAPAGLFVDVPDEFGTTTMVNTPVDFHGTPSGPSWIAPEHGQHTDAVLAEMGVSDDEIEQLRSAGALG